MNRTTFWILYLLRSIRCTTWTRTRAALIERHDNMMGSGVVTPDLGRWETQVSREGR